jgi:hypothetical protein
VEGLGAAATFIEVALVISLMRLGRSLRRKKKPERA